MSPGNSLSRYLIWASHKSHQKNFPRPENIMYELWQRKKEKLLKRIKQTFPQPEKTNMYKLWQRKKGKKKS